MSSRVDGRFESIRRVHIVDVFLLVSSNFVNCAHEDLYTLIKKFLIVNNALQILFYVIIIFLIIMVRRFLD